MQADSEAPIDIEKTLPQDQQEDLADLGLQMTGSPVPLYGAPTGQPKQLSTSCGAETSI